MKRLTIISHTNHYRKASGELVGHGATITELNHLITVFDTIVHIAMQQPMEAPPSALPYTSNRITFMPLPALGGSKLKDKLKLVTAAPIILRTVQKALRESDCFQFRAPTGIGVYVIPYLIYFSSKPGWFKYAGNWKQTQAPLAYRFQRWLLKNQKRKVTINGFWKNQPKQCVSFENPCLTISELQEGQQLIKTKAVDKSKVNFCFVGRLEDAKGLGRLIEAFMHLNVDKQNYIGTINIVGQGKRETNYKQKASTSRLNFKFHGLLPRHEVHKVYQNSHALLLPSASEGFPKVVTEAMNFGCVPIVSNISSLSHYIINKDNGYLLPELSVKGISDTLTMFLELSQEDYYTLISDNALMLEKFTYSYYNSRIINTILNCE